MKLAFVAGSAILIGIAIAAPAPASESAAPPAQRTQAAVLSAYSNQLICKRERQTGTAITKLVCRTQAQIDQELAAAKEYSTVLQRGGIKAPPNEYGAGTVAQSASEQNRFCHRQSFVVLNEVSIVA